MRCCASSTTSIVADAAEVQRRVRDVASAVLFREILKPLAQGLGPLGEIVLGTVADDVFVRKPR
jgi:hypothetical protein